MCINLISVDSRNHAWQVCRHLFSTYVINCGVLNSREGSSYIIMYVSQAVTVCSFSPSMHAQVECLLMHRNCNWKIDCHPQMQLNSPVVNNESQLPPAAVCFGQQQSALASSSLLVASQQGALLGRSPGGLTVTQTDSKSELSSVCRSTSLTEELLKASVPHYCSNAHRTTRGSTPALSFSLFDTTPSLLVNYLPSAGSS